MVTNAEKRWLDTRLTAERNRLMDAYDRAIRADVARQVNAQLREHYELLIAEQIDREVTKYRNSPAGRKYRGDYLAAVDQSVQKHRAELLEEMSLTRAVNEQDESNRRGSTASQGQALLSG